jgi:hypothetical protein
MNAIAAKTGDAMIRATEMVFGIFTERPLGGT